MKLTGWKLIGIGALILVLTGCGPMMSMGSRGVEVHGVNSCSIRYASGTDVIAGFSGDMTMASSKDACAVTITGSGGSSTASKGHEATVDVMEKVVDGVGKVTEGIVRGLKP